MRYILILLFLAASAALSAPVELLANPGFEDGVLTPWTTSNWTVVTTDPHSGTYCAFDEGNYWIKQEFTPSDVKNIVSVTFWYRQPEAAIFAFDFLYGPSDYDEEIVYVTGPNWTEYDLTYFLRSTGNLQAIRFYGYSGAGPDPDYSYLDDVSIIYDESVSLQLSTFGSIKAMFD
ncbi:MAG: hypothetical protein JXR55_00525 [Candidatus Fermentibacteraceae bacterium]|nr:hypothetical protein [Candidatus Fermentibacteraceae bacterium]